MNRFSRSSVCQASFLLSSVRGELEYNFIKVDESVIPVPLLQHMREVCESGCTVRNPGVAHQAKQRKTTSFLLVAKYTNQGLPVAQVMHKIANSIFTMAHK